MTITGARRGEVPWVFTVPELVEWFGDQSDDPSAGQIEEAGCRVGRNYYPALVSDLYYEDLLTASAAQVCVPSAWNSAEFPNRSLDPPLWKVLFDLAGYTVEGVPAARPVGAPLQLWRGAPPGHRRGWAWTDDRDLAQWFAERPHNAGEGRVWTAAVRPWRLLARITEARLGESEYVVDTRRLRIAADYLRTDGSIRP